MPTATAVLGEPLKHPCPNCGTEGVKEVTCQSEGIVGWRGCQQCWSWVLARNQLDVVRYMMRKSCGKRAPQTLLERVKRGG